MIPLSEEICRVQNVIAQLLGPVCRKVHFFVRDPFVPEYFHLFRTALPDAFQLLSAVRMQENLYVVIPDQVLIIRPLPLDGLRIVNDDRPCIYVKSADKVFVTTKEGTESALSVLGEFATDDGKKMNAVIFS